MKKIFTPVFFTILMLALAVNQSAAKDLTKIRIGWQIPLPIVNQSAATSVSFWKDAPPTQETQDGAALVSVSFWIVRPPLPPTEEHTVLLGSPSFSRE